MARRSEKEVPRSKNALTTASFTPLRGRTVSSLLLFASFLLKLTTLDAYASSAVYVDLRTTEPIQRANTLADFVPDSGPSPLQSVLLGNCGPVLSGLLAYKSSQQADEEEDTISSFRWLLFAESSLSYSRDCGDDVAEILVEIDRKKQSIATRTGQVDLLDDQAQKFWSHGKLEQWQTDTSKYKNIHDELNRIRKTRNKKKLPAFIQDVLKEAKRNAAIVLLPSGGFEVWARGLAKARAVGLTSTLTAAIALSERQSSSLVSNPGLLRTSKPAVESTRSRWVSYAIAIGVAAAASAFIISGGFGDDQQRVNVSFPPSAP